ncbi:DUF86 domain-containing protein [Oxalobacteraceae bacterium CAVE-383]|nr:DUF86 domain-containing protein [Oxalobacteraceae bacterium CAVE-383]
MCRSSSGPKCWRKPGRYEREPPARFANGLGKDDFLKDKRTQQAIIMSLIIVGEAATKVMDGYAEFTQAHAQVPWRSMRGMRNRIAHGYFDINLDVVWDTVQTALTALLKQLPAVQQAAAA